MVSMGSPLGFFEVEVELISENLAVEDIDSDLIHETCFFLCFCPPQEKYSSFSHHSLTS
jgi:hypothetical protein